MTTLSRIFLYVTYLFLLKMGTTTALKLSPYVNQESGFVSANVGDKVTLQCFYNTDVATRLYWYKQTLGRKPQLMSVFYVFDINGTFFAEFKNNPRFTLDTENAKNHLKITDLRISDSASYYCATSYTFIFEFAEGITLNVKGLGVNVPALVHQSPSESIQPGGSVTLNCTVHTGSCDGKHTVYWFKHSEESHPGLIYTHGGRNDQCERKANTQTHTCVYNLPMESLKRSHAGTYYCAVASCGHILFGDGIKLYLEDSVDSLVLVYFWNGAFAFTTILSTLLAFLMCMMNRRDSSFGEESHRRFTNYSEANVKGYQNGDHLLYNALKQVKNDISRGQRDSTWSECIYFKR